MLKVIALLSLVLLIFSCRWKTNEQVMIEEKESPVITSLKNSSLPCFNCHSYEKFSIDKREKFSHQNHMNFRVHCNHCHIIKAHKESTINRDVCNRCHKLENFDYEASGMPVNFSHQKHAKKFNCSECHPENFKMKKGTSRITMDEMYKGNSCGKCHNGLIAFASTDCNKCHKMTSFKKELSYTASGVSPAIFSHEFHTDMFKCNNCHESIFKYKKGGSGMRMDEIYNGKFCGSCHNDQRAFGPMKCNKCHK